jgi:hypothetical protein
MESYVAPAAIPMARRARYPLLDPGAIAVLLILAGAFIALTLAWIDWNQEPAVSPGRSFELIMLIWAALLSLLLPILQIAMHIRRLGGSAIRGNRDYYPRLGGSKGGSPARTPIRWRV